MSEQSEISKQVKEILPPLEEVLNEVLRQKPDLYEKIGETKAVNFVSTALRQIGEMETAAREAKNHLPRTAQDAEKIKAILVIAAPGTYLVPRKIDRYRLWSWTEWMDHKRLEYGAYLMRKLTEIKTGVSLTNDPQAFRETILKAGPDLLYSARFDERKMAEIALKMSGKVPPKEIREAILALGDYPTEDIERALKIKPSNLPEERVHFLEGKLDNTVDSAQQLYFPDSISFLPGDKLGVVIHSPQGMRFLYNLQAVMEANQQAAISGQILPFPKFPLKENSPVLKIFPLPLPIEPTTGYPTRQYPTLEICGLIHYAFYANPQLAAEKPYPYEL